ncbi:hypothetical protein BDV96DRAFT_651118 [Lophiotrema nucula]|uniref:Uncharacterized protein n=1 Tax=Lophiotrema nucula TaxID=690887 RepID=A0A6A5YU47_9PLEO|nr:hypothetical protein BDV96DRAFT_651118 [Lophiotrema nucula]
MGNENPAICASPQEVAFDPAKSTDELFRRVRTNSDPSPTGRRASFEPRMASPTRALTQTADEWESSSSQRPLPPLPANDMPRDTASRSIVSRRPIGPTTRPPKPVRTSVPELERLLDEAERVAKDKEEEIQRLTIDNARLRNEWQNTSASLAATKATVSHILEDKHFSSAWKQLRFSIKNWAYQHFGQRAPAMNSLKKWYKTQNPPEHMVELSRYWTEYMKSDDHRPLLVQAFVWNILVKHVFANEPRKRLAGNQTKDPRAEPKLSKPDGAYWAFGEQQWLARLNEDLKPGYESLSNPDFKPLVQSYFTWRISNAVFIQEKLSTYSGPNHNIAPLVKSVMKHLAPFAGTDSSPPMSTPRVEKELGIIISEAIQLDAEMWRQKAFFHPGSLRASPDSPFNPSSMELWETPPDAYANTLPPISLIISPCLMKTGNADGDFYDTSNILVKSQVSGEFAYQQMATKPSVAKTSTALQKGPMYQPSHVVQVSNQRVQYEKMHPNASVVERGPGEITPYLGPRRVQSTSRKSMDTHRGVRSRDFYA